MKRTLGLLAAAVLLGAARAPDAPPVARFNGLDYSGAQPVYAREMAGPGRYLNPVLEGFYPDPSLTRAGDAYYLVNSTFAYFPGVPVWKSRDLVHWTQVGDAIDRPSQLRLSGLGVSRGVFAPDITFHDGVFYLLNTCVDCGGNYLLTATDPAGPWSDPVWLPFDGIDPSMFFDSDGRAYLVNNGPPPGAPLYPGHRAIWVQRFDLKSHALVGPRTMIVNGGVDISKHPSWIEGPHVFKRRGFYYLIAAEGGTGDQHSEVVFRSRRITGPFRPWSHNPILTQRDLAPGRPDPITSTGHADFVQTPAGDWWAVFLGTRPFAPDAYDTGRETFLMPVRWTADGWPVITPRGSGVPYVEAAPRLPVGPSPSQDPPQAPSQAPSQPRPTAGDFAVSERFERASLPRDWMMLRNPSGQPWWRTGSGLALQARPQRLGGSGQPSFLARRLQHMDATAATTLRFAPTRDGQEAGLAAFQNESHYLLIAVAREHGRRVVRLERRAADADPVEGVEAASAPLAGEPDAPVRLKVELRGPSVRFSYAEGAGPWRALGGVQDAHLLTTKAAGGFVGAVLGLYAFTPPPT